MGHPNIVRITDTGTTPAGAPYLIMEFLTGKSLAAVLVQEGSLALGRAITIMVHVLDALAAVHHKGVIHRDLKPDNIFLAEQGRPGRPKTVVKVLDFGLAKPIDLMLGEKKLTRFGFTVGTPFYMPPEQARTQRVDRRSDLFAAGVTLYEMLTGALPFTGDTFYGLVAAMTAGNPLPPSSHRPELPPALDAVMLKAIASEPKDRFQNADEFIQALSPFAPAGLITGLYTSRLQVPVVASDSTGRSPQVEEQADTEQDLPQIPVPGLPRTSRLPDGAQPPSTQSEVPVVWGSKNQRWVFLVGTLVCAGLVASLVYFLDGREVSEPEDGTPPHPEQMGQPLPPHSATDAGSDPDASGGGADAFARDLATEVGDAVPTIEVETDGGAGHRPWQPSSGPALRRENRLGFETKLPPPPPHKRNGGTLVPEPSLPGPRMGVVP
jgi:serine/threonine-protein kinase